MIKKLTDLERSILVVAVEERCWANLRQHFEKDDFGVECDCKWNRKGEVKEVCNHCCNIIDGIFNKIGWYNNTHYVFGVKKLSQALKDLWFEIRYWYNYSILKKKLKYFVVNKKGKLEEREI
jgi:hypothetical protein